MFGWRASFLAQEKAPRLLRKYAPAGKLTCTPPCPSPRRRYQKEIDAMYVAAGDLVAGKSGLKQGKH